MNAITKEQLIEDLKASTQNSSGMFEIGEDTICNLMSMLTAHPAPVAPDEMTPQQASRSYGGEVRGYRDGWNACRAAMLQGKSEQPQNAQQNIPENIPGGNSPGIPDGWISCSERMPEKYDVDIWVFSLSRGVLDGLQWDGSMFTDDEYQFVIHDATHWMRKAYPAAPQQEVE